MVDDDDIEPPMRDPLAEMDRTRLRGSGLGGAESLDD